MEEVSERGERVESHTSDARDELRTIGFRLREIQRLLSMRVQQENRRLEAEGIDPIAEATFFKRTEARYEASQDARRRVVESLGGLDVFDETSVTLDDGTTIQGRANPITYTPNDRLRLELRSRGEGARYELEAECTDEGWTTPVVRRYLPEEDEWNELGALDAMRTLH